MATSSDPAETGSDMFVPHICDPCKFLGKDKGATAYCGKCNAYLCKSCEESHRGLQATRDHALVTGSMLTSTFKPSPTLPISFCDDHKSNVINGFCEEHMTLLCDVCSTVKHRKCRKTALRNKTSKMIKIQLNKLVNRMEEIKQKVEKLRTSRNDDADLLMNYAKQSVNDVKVLRSKINGTLDVLEKNVLKAIDDIKKKEESGLRDHMAACENILKQIDESIKEMQGCQSSMNEEIMFIGLTKSSGKVEEMEKIATDVASEATKCQVTFKPNEVIEEILRQVKELGKVITTTHSTATSIEENVLEMKVSSKHILTINTRWITGSTFLPNDSLVLCDRENKRLHLLNPAFTTKESVELPSWPWGVWKVTDTEVVVTLPDQQKIQFVSVQPWLRLGQSLNVQRKCWGIDCHGGMMYVTCHDDPGNGEVLVMTMDGQVERRLGVDDQGRYMFIHPHYVRVSSTSGHVYVTDHDAHTVSCLTQAGDVAYQYRHRVLSDPNDIHIDSQDNILVCGWGSRNIHRFYKNGSHHSILVSEKDGVEYPWCLSYRDTDGALVVGMKSKFACMVFWLKK